MATGEHRVDQIEVGLLQVIAARVAARAGRRLAQPRRPIDEAPAQFLEVGGALRVRTCRHACARTHRPLSSRKTATAGPRQGPAVRHPGDAFRAYCVNLILVGSATPARVICAPSRKVRIVPPLPSEAEVPRKVPPALTEVFDAMTSVVVENPVTLSVAPLPPVTLT